MENARKFFEEVMKTEEAKNLLASVKNPETEQERTAAYLDIAGKLGVELTAEEIRAYFLSADLEVCGSVELDDEELDQLTGGAGGQNPMCKVTFRHAEDCWWNDGCDRFFQKYTNYLCSKNNLKSTRAINL